MAAPCPARPLSPHPRRMARRAPTGCASCCAPPCPTRAATRRPAGAGRRTSCSRAATWTRMATPSTTACSSPSGSAGTSGWRCRARPLRPPAPGCSAAGPGCARRACRRPAAAWCASGAATPPAARLAPGAAWTRPAARRRMRPWRRPGTRCWTTGAPPSTSAAAAVRCARSCTPRSRPGACRRCCSCRCSPTATTTGAMSSARASGRARPGWARASPARRRAGAMQAPSSWAGATARSSQAMRPTMPMPATRSNCCPAAPRQRRAPRTRPAWR